MKIWKSNLFFFM